MLTGYNTDVPHEGVVYHVQTEDKGLETPIVLSLVYLGGAILASKRAPYDDLIAAGFDEAVLAERIGGDAPGGGHHRDLRVLQPELRLRRGRPRPPQIGVSPDRRAITRRIADQSTLLMIKFD